MHPNESRKSKGKTDREFLSDLGLCLRKLDKLELKNLIPKLIFEPIDPFSGQQQLRKKAIELDVADSEVAMATGKHYAFLSLQSLIEPLSRMGYDPRDVLLDPGNEILKSIYDFLSEKADSHVSEVSGSIIEIDGRKGMAFSKYWLRRAKITDAQIGGETSLQR